MSRTFIEAIINRRSNYLLENISPVSTAHILDTIDTILSVVPSPFNAQSARVVVLFGEQHLALWDIVEQELKSRIPSDIFDKTRQKQNYTTHFAQDSAQYLFMKMRQHSTNYASTHQTMLRT